MSPTKSIRHGALTVSVPMGWDDRSQVIAVAPEVDGFRSSLVVSVEPVTSSETAAQLAARMLPNTQRVAPGFTLVNERDALFGGNKGVLREYTVLMQGQRVAQLQFYTVRDSVGFTFTYTQRADLLARTRSVAETAFASAQVGMPATESVKRLGFIRT
ncbi:DcrB-related protein [Myxococcaceae bacterium JPH2]|nr:DcrB-related protein [Myxococcaceae bacterium JPH2]